LLPCRPRPVGHRCRDQPTRPRPAGSSARPARHQLPRSVTCSALPHRQPPLVPCRRLLSRHRRSSADLTADGSCPLERLAQGVDLGRGDALGYKQDADVDPEAPLQLWDRVLAGLHTDPPRAAAAERSAAEQAACPAELVGLVPLGTPGKARRVGVPGPPPARRLLAGGSVSLYGSHVWPLALWRGPTELHACRTRRRSEPLRRASARGLADNTAAAWWAQQGSNLRPLVCKTRALPLSYAPRVLERAEPGHGRPHTTRERRGRKKATTAGVSGHQRS